MVLNLAACSTKSGSSDNVSEETEVVEEVTSQTGSGHKAVLENGNVYCLLDEYPDQLSLFYQAHTFFICPFCSPAARSYWRVRILR